MIEKLYKLVNKRPGLYEKANDMWNNPHISKKMLEAHLDENFDGATRRYDFVKKSAEWIAAKLPPAQYPELLDLGCGPGIYDELFCDMGYHVTGMDVSERSVRHAKDSAKSKGLDIEYILGDYTAAEFSKPCNLAVMIYCDFGVLSGGTRKELLRKIYDALLPGGVLLFDVFTAHQYEGREEFRNWEIEDNGFWHERKCLWLHSFYRYDKECVFLNQYAVATDEDVSCYNIWEHGFTAEELNHDLKEAGFGSVEFYGDAAGGEYDETGMSACVLAKK